MNSHLKSIASIWDGCLAWWHKAITKGDTMNDMNGCCKNAQDFTNLVGLVWDVLKSRLEDRRDFDRLEYRRHGDTCVEIIAWHEDANNEFVQTGYGVTISPFFTMPAIMQQINNCVNDFI